MKLLITLGLIFLTSSSYANDFKLEKVVSGLDSPWAITFLDENTLFVNEKAGNAKSINLSNNQISDIAGLPFVDDSGQGGLLDVSKLPEQFNQSNSPTLYFTYSKPLDAGTATVLAKAQLDNNRLVNWQDLLVTQSAGYSSRHFGSRIAFDQDGHVYFSVGDRGERPNGQNLKTHSGSILRVNLDGSVPSDNPFINSTDVLPEIWSYGHRNPQGITFDRQGNLWAIEHGPRGGDEINLIQKGANYGWPVISYGKEYWGPIAVGEGTHKKGMEQPYKYYVPSIAPGSLIAYSGKLFTGWENKLMAGALKLQHINIVDTQDPLEELRILKNLRERIRDLVEAENGEIYLSTDDGNIYKLTKK